MADKYSEFISTLDAEFLASGQYKIELEQAFTLYKEKKLIFLDVRSDNEHDVFSFSFAQKVPLNMIPDVLDSIPKDKVIAIFCMSKLRASMAYLYLNANGFNQAKILGANISDLAGYCGSSVAKELKK